MTKKICYVTTISGTMGFFERQLLFLAKKGFEVCVISSDDGILQENTANKNAKKECFCESGPQQGREVVLKG